jgi:hypothetical protein
MESQEFFEKMKHDSKDPDPWLALYLDQSLPLNPKAKAALLMDMRSKSRQFLLPLVRPFTRMAIILNQVLKIFIPNYFTSSKVLHKLIYWGLNFWVKPDSNCNFLILRHFHIGSEILAFIADNVEGVEVPLRPLKPQTLKELQNDLFLQHDLNIFNFVINLNSQLKAKGLLLKPRENLNFNAITDGPFSIAPLPHGWTNFIDIQTAIEIYTPFYQLLLTDNDFWRASNSLQLDETISCYIAVLLNDPTLPAFVNNKHPLVPLSTLNAAYRLMLHGVSAETLHAMLVQAKRNQK